MPNSTVAYQLGCKYASKLLEKTALGEQLLQSGGKLLKQLGSSRNAQYALGGLGGAGLGALAGGEDNRLRGAMLGAGAGLGAVGLGRRGAALGSRSVSTPRVLETVEQRGLAYKPKNMEKVRSELERNKAIQGALIGGGVGALGGATAAGIAAPAHREQAWTNKLRGLLPF